jgi:hypothetical protein
MSAPRRENLACDTGIDAGWPSRMSRPLAVKGVGACSKHVKRARAAYDVVSRTQLVACVLRDALVSFDEAIPPNR